MFLLVWRKIVNNAWKVACLLTGSILAVGMICSIPVYSEGILQRMLIKDLENQQIKEKTYPGYLVIDSDFTYIDKSDVSSTAERLRQQMASLQAVMPLPAALTCEFDQIGRLYYTAEVNGKTSQTSIQLGGLSDFTSHVTIIKGRMASDEISEGVIETVVSAATLKNTGMVMDRIYEVSSFSQAKGEAPLLKVKIVGIYEPADSQDIYWFKYSTTFKTTLMADLSLIQSLSDIDASLVLKDQSLCAAYAYHDFDVRTISQLTEADKAGESFEAANLKTSKFSSTFAKVITGYPARERQLQLTLQILIVPILLMVMFYIFMVSQLMIRGETAAISVLESRGAGRRQILLLYGLESLLLGLATLLAGPPLGLWMVSIIGSSNGFLEFVTRKALQIRLGGQSLLFGIVAVVLIIVTTLLPVLVQSRLSIVQQKQKKSRRTRQPFWKRYFLDIILLAVSLYAWYRLNMQLTAQKTSGGSGTGSDMDMLLFLASTLFIIGAGLLFLRLFPLLLQLVYMAGQRLWSPALYASFHQIGRSDGQEQFLMIFLILALSIGLFNANAARTINQNAEDTIFCQTGADIVLQEFWQPYDQDGKPVITTGGMNFEQALESADTSRVIKYYEPSLSRFSELEGVAHATRVWRSDATRIRIGGKTSDSMKLMAIDSYDFAQTAWTRSDLNKYSMNEYMNVMTTMPNAVILSANLKDELGLAVGDPIVFTVNNSDTATGIIIAFVDSWPGFQPLKAVGNGTVTENSLLIANLDYCLSVTAIRPYQIWIRRDVGANDRAIYDAIEKAGLSVTSITSANQLIASAKNDPQLQGTNGALTLGFLVSMLICAIGFLIYWILAIQGRVLQFGVFRAMGMGRGPLMGMLVSEQIMISGVAILAGVVLGALSSSLFVPLFQLVYTSADQPLPFRVIAQASDSVRVLAILGVLLIGCLAVLARLTLRIRIAQAVKLGEE